jgi:hypothetical protein
MNGARQLDIPIAFSGERAEDQAPAATPAPTPARRRPATRRLVAGIAGIAVAVGLAGFATLMHRNASFAKGNISRQLTEQQISFKPAEALTAEEREHPCLVAYAGKPLTTGAEARCYANDFIGVHLKSVADGRTFSQMRTIQDDLRARIATAQAGNDPSLGDLQRQLGEVTGKRQALFEGETMRGLLMTTYGFSTLGSKAGQAATAASFGGLAILALSLAVVVSAAAGRRRDARRQG